MYKAIGSVTGKVYATGTNKCDCHRVLNEKYREIAKRRIYTSGNSQKVTAVYPEPLIITDQEVKVDA